jgi:5-methylcytosine-specific restriction endonuclease McrA
MRLKLRLIKEGFFEYRCMVCQRTEWQDSPMPLELHHINGDRMDHRLENLQLLCPNCHALTPTYRARNKGRLASA